MAYDFSCNYWIKLLLDKTTSNYFLGNLSRINLGIKNFQTLNHSFHIVITLERVSWTVHQESLKRLQGNETKPSLCI